MENNEVDTEAEEAKDVECVEYCSEELSKILTQIKAKENKV